MRVCVSQAAIDPEIGRAIRDSVQVHQVRVIGERLRRHREAGRIPAEIDLEAIALAISGLGFAGAFMQRIVFGGSRAEVEDLLRKSAAAIADGIARNCPSNSIPPVIKEAP
jgi:hypothetical protein